MIYQISLFSIILGYSSELHSFLHRRFFPFFCHHFLPLLRVEIIEIFVLKFGLFVIHC